MVSQFQQTPTEVYIEAVLRIILYIKNTSNKKLFLCPYFNIIVYIDIGWG